MQQQNEPVHNPLHTEWTKYIKHGGRQNTCQTNKCYLNEQIQARP